MDMLVNLTGLPPVSPLKGVRIVRALAPDHAALMAFVRENFGDGWAGECGQALATRPNTCFEAVCDGEIKGFACYDATAKGFFGPIGVAEDQRGRGIGRALLMTCLHAMAWDGYGYAVIGWCDGAADFYRTVGAVPIPGSTPAHSVYSRLLRCPEDQ